MCLGLGKILLVIKNFLLTGYVLTSCYCIYIPGCQFAKIWFSVGVEWLMTTKLTLQVNTISTNKNPHFHTIWLKAINDMSYMLNRVHWCMQDSMLLGWGAE